jgi:retron-type reverse transcriptase
LIDGALLAEAYRRLRRDAAPGVDGVTAAEYGRNLEGNLRDLHRRLRDRSYRAQPARRAYIEKEGGKQRAPGLPALEDKRGRAGILGGAGGGGWSFAADGG